MTKELTAFLIHQVIGTLGVVMASARSRYTFLEVLRLGRIGLTGETATFPLLGIPGFPFQAASGFVLGFTLARRLPARTAVLVWILPLLWFVFGALAVAPTSTLDYLVGGSCNANHQPGLFISTSGFNHLAWRIRSLLCGRKFSAGVVGVTNHRSGGSCI